MATPTTQNLYRRQLDEGFSQLRFVPALEAPYRQDHLTRRASYSRTGMLIAAGFYAMFLVVAWNSSGGEIWNLPTMIRFGVILSLLICAKLIPSIPGKWRGHSVVLTYILLAAGITAIEIIAQNQGSVHRYEGILLAIIHCCFFSGLLFRTCALCVCVMFWNYLLAGWVFELPAEDLGIQAFFCLLAGWMGLTAVFLTERAERENFLNRQLMNISANFDELTGLASRAAFDRYLPQHLRHCALQGEEQQALVLVDIDYFKQLNDTRGHDTGDKCLQLVADVLAGSVSGDTRAVARWGGDELIAVTEVEDEATLRKHLDSMRRSIEDLRMQNTGSPFGVLTISIGAVIVPTALRLQENLLFRQADAALYRAKQSGRNRLVIEAAQAIEQSPTAEALPA